MSHQDHPRAYSHKTDKVSNMGEALRNDIFPKVPPVTRKYFCALPNCQFFEDSKGQPKVFLSRPCSIGVEIRGTDRWITYPFDF